MPQIVNTNIASLNAQRNLNKSQGSLQTSLQRLSSGLRINSAKDDAAGLAISDRFTTQIRGLNVAIRNANDAISFSQTAEGALGEITNIVQRMRDLAVQSANASNSTADRQSLQEEVSQLTAEIDRIASNTTFNGRNIIDGSLGTLNFHVGANANETVGVTGVDARASALGSQPGLVQSVGGRVSTANGAADAGTQGIQTGASTTVITATDMTIQVGSGTAVDIADTQYGGDINLAALTGVQSNSALLIAERINNIRVAGDLEGVFATATTTFDISDAVAADLTSTVVPAAADQNIGAGSIANGDLNINGVDIGPAQFLANDSDGSLVSAINAKTSQTGVEASVDVNGALVLTADDGRDIILNTANSANDTIFGGANVASFDAEFVDLRVTGQVTISAQDTITVAGGGTEIEAGFAGAIVDSNVQATGSIANADVTTVVNANLLIASADSAIGQIDSLRAELGAIQNRFESTISNLSNVSENLSAARSRILDADFASETANLTRAQILQQAGISVLSQANALPQQVLALLQ